MAKKREGELPKTPVKKLKTITNVDHLQPSGVNKLYLRNIEALRQMGQQPLTFTFEDFDRGHEYFNLSRVGLEWFILLLDTLKELSKKTWPEVQQDSYYDAHPHDWSKTTTRFQKDKYEQYEGVQFSLGSNRGRVHGYIIGNLFFVVWLDKYHNLYDMEGYPSVKSKIKNMKDYPGVSCIQVYNTNIKILTDKIGELESRIKKLESDIELYLKINSEIEEQNIALKKENDHLNNIISIKRKKQEKYKKKVEKWRRKK
ncbi:MAG: hypothetical protein QM315_05000 [Bacillota bacterium]|mgnify:CR=1 FL=1|jgi:ribosomal protein L32E|nr:hypothetical protein [Bacillota bacterium]NLV63682.1 hypothetical protein [Clostridiaceae bacterium]